MSTAVASREMAKKKPGPKPGTPRNDVTAKIDAEAMQYARLVATFRQQTIAEYLTEVVGKAAKTEWEKIKNTKD